MTKQTGFVSQRNSTIKQAAQLALILKKLPSEILKLPFDARTCFEIDYALLIEARDESQGKPQMSREEVKRISEYSKRMNAVLPQKIKEVFG